MLNVDLSMLLTVLYVVNLGLFLGRLRNVEKRAAAYEKEIAKLRAAAEEHFQAKSERMVKEVRLEVQRAIEESRRELESDSSSNALLKMTQDDQKRIIVRFIENL